MRVDQLAGLFLDYLLVEKGASTNTLHAYRNDLTRYAEFAEQRGIGSAEEIQQRDVSQFVTWLRGDGRGAEAKQLSAASATRALVAVRRMHDFAVRERLLATDPARAVKPPQVGFRLPSALTTDEVFAMLATLLDDPAGRRDLALLEFLYGTGCRASEACTVDVDDLQREERLVRLLGKGRKMRLVPYGSSAAAALDSYLTTARPQFVARGRGTPALFVNQRGGRLTRQSVWSIVRRAAERAELGDHVHPHTLRHSYATHLLEGGADIRVVQELLGHSSVTTTQVYTLVTPAHLEAVYATSHPRARA